MGIGDLVQDGLIIDGPHYRRNPKGSGKAQYWTVLWNNGKQQKIRLKEVKVISHAE